MGCSKVWGTSAEGRIAISRSDLFSGRVGLWQCSSWSPIMYITLMVTRMTSVSVVECCEPSTHLSPEAERECRSCNFTVQLSTVETFVLLSGVTKGLDVKGEKG